ncbi:MAG: hypothetical protein ACYC2E_09400 [Sulfuricella sp.]
MKKETVLAISVVITLLVTPVIANAMTNIPVEPKKGTSTPKNEATQVKSEQSGVEKGKAQDVVKKNSNKKENPRSK